MVITFIGRSLTKLSCFIVKVLHKITFSACLYVRVTYRDVEKTVKLFSRAKGTRGDREDCNDNYVYRGGHIFFFYSEWTAGFSILTALPASGCNPPRVPSHVPHPESPWFQVTLRKTTTVVKVCGAISLRECVRVRATEESRARN